MQFTGRVMRAMHISKRCANASECTPESAPQGACRGGRSGRSNFKPCLRRQNELLRLRLPLFLVLAAGFLSPEFSNLRPDRLRASQWRAGFCGSVPIRLEIIFVDSPRTQAHSRTEFVVPNSYVIRAYARNVLIASSNLFCRANIRHHSGIIRSMTSLA